MIDDLRRELATREEDLRSSRSHAEGCKQALVRHSRQGNSLRIAQQKAEDRVEELRDALDKETVEDGRLEALQASLNETEAEKKINEGSYRDCANAIDEVMQRLKSIRRDVAAKDEEIAVLKDSLQAAQNEESGIADRRARILSEKNAAIRQISTFQQEKMRLERKREQVVKRIIEYSEKAGLVSERVAIDEGETPISLDKKLERSHRDLENFSNQ